MRLLLRLIKTVFWFGLIGILVSILVFPESTVMLRGIPYVGPIIQPAVTWICTQLNHLLGTLGPVVAKTAGDLENVQIASIVGNKNTWTWIGVVVVVVVIVWAVKNRGRFAGAGGIIKNNYQTAVLVLLAGVSVWLAIQNSINIPALIVMGLLGAGVIAGGVTFSKSASKTIGGAAEWLFSKILYALLLAMVTTFGLAGTGLINPTNIRGVTTSLGASEKVGTAIDTLLIGVGNIALTLGPLPTAILFIAVGVVVASKLFGNRQHGGAR